MSDEEAEKDRVLALPQTHDVRWWWVEGRGDMVSKTSSEDQFDRWLAAVKRETAAQAREEALKEAADAIGRRPVRIDPLLRRVPTGEL
jgi:hypothetical protein